MGQLVSESRHRLGRPYVSFDRTFNQLKACLIFSANALKGWRVMR
jgi:hypothetical protein